MFYLELIEELIFFKKKLKFEKTTSTNYHEMTEYFLKNIIELCNSIKKAYE